MLYVNSIEELHLIIPIEDFEDLIINSLYLKYVLDEFHVREVSILLLQIERIYSFRLSGIVRGYLVRHSSTVLLAHHRTQTINNILNS